MRVRGTGRLAATAHAAAGQLADVPTDSAAAILAQAARTRAPRLSGALAASISAYGGVVRVGVEYGGVIEGGWRGHGIEPQPYLSPAIVATEPARTAAVEADVQAVLDRIRGA